MAADKKEPYGAGITYADPGYQKDGVKRYPLDSKSHARSAWSYINMDKNAAKYTAAQLKRIKARIVKALRKFGVQVSEGVLLERFEVTEALAESMGMAMMDDATQPGSFCVSLDNGMVQVMVSSYRIDPHDLTAVGRAAMDGAIKALLAMDPDDDGDIDVDGAPAQDLDHDGGDGDEADDDEMEAAAEAAPETSAAVEETAAGSTATPDPAAEPNESEEVPAVGEATNPAAVQPAAVVTFSTEQFAQLLSAIRPQDAATAAATESAPDKPAEKVAEAVDKPAEPVVESDEQRIQRLVEEKMAAQRTALIQEIAEKSGVPRKGLVTESTDAATGEVGGGDGATNSHGLPAGWPDKPLHQYTDAERKQYLSGQLVGAVLGNRGGAGNRAQ